MKTDKPKYAPVCSTRPKPHIYSWLVRKQRKGKKGERKMSAILDEALELLYAQRHSERKREATAS